MSGESVTMASIKWTKDSKKVGKLLEHLAEIVEIEAHRRSEELQDQAFDAGYAHALAEVQERGLAQLLKSQRDPG